MPNGVVLFKKLLLNMENQAPYHLIALWVNQTISTEEENILNAWRQASEANEAEFKQMVSLLKAPASRPNYPNTEQSWQKLSSKLQLQKQSKLGLTLFYRIAAVLVMFFMAGIVYKTAIYNQQDVLVETANNQHMQITLPDGSVAWLNKNSSITYKKGFAKRNIHVTGQVYFEVKSNPDKPFEVISQHTTTTVLGTGFTVNANAINGVLNRVVVKHGKVKVKNNANESFVLLLAGQEAVLNTSGYLVLQPTISKNAFAWQENKLVFENTSIKQIIADLQQLYDVTITVSDASIEQCMFTGEFTNPKLQEVLLVISKTLGITYSINQKQVIISGKGC